MSASLVGSEMCIRDRFLIPTSPSARVTDPGGIRGGVGGVRTRSMRGRTPVSYTHLTLPTICSV
eukprot:11614677-Alexandrium_andersonii.AAC.1